MVLVLDDLLPTGVTILVLRNRRVEHITIRAVVRFLTVPGCEPSFPRHVNRLHLNTSEPDPTSVCSLPHVSRHVIRLLMGGDTSTTRRWSQR